MATRSTSESGHEKNVANFAKLAATVESFGAQYNPSSEALKVASLKSLSTDIGSAVTGERDGRLSYKTIRNGRRDMFKKKLPVLIRRSINALKSTDADKKTAVDMNAILKKIVGENKKKAVAAQTTPEAETPDTISTSQRSFDSLAAHAKSAASYLGKVSQYSPNETELTVSSIKAFADSLEAENMKVTNAANTMIKSRTSRNALLYKPTAGACDVSVRVKEYVKSVFGAKSPEYKTVSKIDLRNYGKK